MLAPSKADKIGVLDVQTAQLSQVPMPGLTANTARKKFSGAVNVNGVIVFVPFGASDIGMYDAVRSSFSTIHIATYMSAIEYKFSGAAVGTGGGSSSVLGRVYFAPYDHNEVGVLDLGQLSGSPFSTLSLPRG